MRTSLICKCLCVRYYRSLQHLGGGETQCMKIKLNSEVIFHPQPRYIYLVFYHLTRILKNLVGISMNMQCWYCEEINRKAERKRERGRYRATRQDVTQDMEKLSQQLIWWPDLTLLSCCWVSLHFLCDTLSSRRQRVIEREDIENWIIISLPDPDQNEPRVWCTRMDKSAVPFPSEHRFAV